jgi:hypothetical protein
MENALMATGAHAVIDYALMGVGHVMEDPRLTVWNALRTPIGTIA